MKNKLFCLLLVLSACTPDDYYQADEAEIGYALMTNVYGYPEPDTLYCIRKIEGRDTSYWETGCFDNRITPQQGDSKDSIYRTYPWPLIRFVPYPKAVARFEKCN